MADKKGLKEAKKNNSNPKVAKTLLKVVATTIGAGVALIAGTNKIMKEATKDRSEQENEDSENRAEKADEETEEDK